MSYRKVDRLLKRQGFVKSRQTGGHVIYQHPDGRATVVPRHGGDIDARLVAKILKDGGIDPDSVRR